MAKKARAKKDLDGSFESYLSMQEAADELGISYSVLLSRTRKGKIPFVKKGWAKFIHVDEVKKAKGNGAPRKDLAKRTR